VASFDWSDEENDLIVGDYFDMLRMEIAGESFNKAERNRMLQSRLTTRSRGSIEFKHQNISAAMLGLNQHWIEGYKPMSNFQFNLVEAVVRQLDKPHSWAANEFLKQAHFDKCFPIYAQHLILRHQLYKSVHQTISPHGFEQQDYKFRLVLRI
jgi:hypothetical protein